MQDTDTTVALTDTAKIPATKTKATPVVAKAAPKKVAKAQPIESKTEVAPKAAPVAKTARKSAAKPAVKALPKRSIKPAAKPKAEKAIVPKKAKLVRDSFTIPKLEYTVLADLKQRAGMLSTAAKKGELIRAGIKALAAMSDPAFLAALNAVPTIKTGRPGKTTAE